MKHKKHICIIGLGEFGTELARELSRECEVLVLDRDENRVNAIVDQVQRALILDVRDFAGLSSVVTADFDEVIVSIGEDLEASILCTLHLKKIGVRSIQAKAKTGRRPAGWPPTLSTPISWTSCPWKRITG